MVDRTSDIPKEFSLKEQYQVLRRAIEIRKDFISMKRGRNQMGDEQYNLDMYNVAALEAALETIGRAYAAHRDANRDATNTEPSATKPDPAPQQSPEDAAAEARRRAMAESGDDGF